MGFTVTKRRESKSFFFFSKLIAKSDANTLFSLILTKVAHQACSNIAILDMLQDTYHKNVIFGIHHSICYIGPRENSFMKCVCHSARHLCASHVPTVFEDLVSDIYSYFSLVPRD